MLSAVLLVAVGCGRGEPAKPARPPAAPVVTVEAVRRDVPVLYSTFGNVEPVASAQIRSRVDGQLLEVHFADGQEVSAGDLLFTIDPRPFQAALEQARANLNRDIAQAENAEAEYRRAEDLLKKGVLTQEQYDAAKATYHGSQGTVKADQAAVETAKLQLGYCYIRAPFAGRMGAALIQIGNQIKANDLPMAVLNQMRPIEVSFTAPESRLAEIRRGMATGELPVTAKPPADHGEPPRGHLIFVDNAVDQTTGTVRLKAHFANEDERLWPGQFVTVSLTLRVIPGAVVVPSRAVQTSQAGRYVWNVAPDMTARMLPATVGVSFDGETVIEKGLAPGESVVVDGQMRLFPGAPVLPRREGQGATAPAAQPSRPAAGPGSR